MMGPRLQSPSSLPPVSLQLPSSPPPVRLPTRVKHRTPTQPQTQPPTQKRQSPLSRACPRSLVRRKSWSSASPAQPVASAPRLRTCWRALMRCGYSAMLAGVRSSLRRGYRGCGGLCGSRASRSGSTGGHGCCARQRRPGIGARTVAIAQPVQALTPYQIAQAEREAREKRENAELLAQMAAERDEYFRVNNIVLPF